MSRFWSDVAARLKSKVSEQTYVQWFQQIRFGSRDAGKVELWVPNQFISDWLKDHYRALLETTVEEVCGEALKVTFRVTPKEAVVDETLVGREASVSRSVALREQAEPGLSTQRRLPPPAADSDREVAEKLDDMRVGTRRRMNGEEPTFNPKYTFANYVVDDPNRLAQAAAQAVARRPGQEYNPLLIHGGVGLGKTHLLHAIGHAAARGFGQTRTKGGFAIKLLTCEAFVNDFIDAIHKKRAHDFRKSYRDHCDMLLIDDIHFISDKFGSQEELFHIFDALSHAGVQMVFTSDKKPSEITGLEDRLRSRLQSGLVTEVRPPRYEARMAILQKRSRIERIDLPDDVTELIAHRVDTNVRDLIGVMLRVGAMSQLTGVPITRALVEEVMSDEFAMRAREITPDDVMKTTCKFYGVKLSDVKGKSRVAQVLVPRQVAMYLMRKHTRLSLQEIGRRFGGKDHSTVLSSIQKIERLLLDDADTRRKIAAIESQTVAQAV